MSSDFKPCTKCGHGMAAHDIRARDQARTVCSVLLGPRGARCGCKAYSAPGEGQ